MKKGKDCLVSKYVYRLEGDNYFRFDYFGKKMYLSAEFPSIAKIASISYSFKVYMLFDGRETTAWIDKHSNVIVRVIDNSIKQTKINF